jgi:hypothetical protein
MDQCTRGAGGTGNAAVMRKRAAQKAPRVHWSIWTPSTVAGLSLFCRASVAFLSPDHRSGRATRGLPAGAAQRAARYSATPRCVIMLA